MEQVLALGSVIPALVGAGCCTATRQRDTITVTAMVLMVSAMIDTMLVGSILLQPLSWAAILAACAMTLGATQFRRPLGAERAAHVGVMAFLTAAMGSAHGVPYATGHSAESDSHAHHTLQVHTTVEAGMGWGSQLLVVVAVGVGAAFSAVLLIRAFRARSSCTGSRGNVRGLDCVERIVGALSLLAMAAMVTVM
jgi:hypothetical protein